MADMTPQNNRFAIALALLLGLFYLFVLYLMLNPNVSDEYRKYYIERSTNLSIFEQQKLAHKLEEPILTIRYDDQDTYFNHWYGREKSLRWSQGDHASIGFELPNNRSPQGYLILTARYLGNQRVGISLNGRELVDVESKTLPSQYILSVDPELLRTNSSNEIRFRFPDARPASKNDGRMLAMALESLEIY